MTTRPAPDRQPAFSAVSATLRRGPSLMKGPGCARRPRAHTHACGDASSGCAQRSRRGDARKATLLWTQGAGIVLHGAGF